MRNEDILGCLVFSIFSLFPIIFLGQPKIKKMPTEPTSTPTKQTIIATEYNMLNHLLSLKSNHPKIKRQIRKLKLIIIKKTKQLPIFSIESVLSNLSKPTILPKRNYKVPINIPFPQRNLITVTAAQDRFIKLQNFTIPISNSLSSFIYGFERIGFKSDWTGKFLPAYIYRNKEKCNGKIKRLLDEINGGSDDGIDYVYLDKSLLSQVNDLLCLQFWDGIDASESLLFPDFTIVALYKNLVVGVALMTPECYISYFTVRFGWENDGIGKFMMYNMVKFSAGRDLTLHVGVDNPACLLYNYFGFKPEQFIVGFYDRYFTTSSKRSRNAFFVRLRR